MFNYPGLTPSSPKIGQQTHFKIIFINKETEENQKHTDYRFLIQGPDGNNVDLQSPHSGWGAESASYTLKRKENLNLGYLFLT